MRDRGRGAGERRGPSVIGRGGWCGIWQEGGGESVSRVVQMLRDLRGLPSFRFARVSPE